MAAKGPHRRTGGTLFLDTKLPTARYVIDEKVRPFYCVNNAVVVEKRYRCYHFSMHGGKSYGRRILDMPVRARRSFLRAS
jgi:hypothetical protein